jgi:hypothetical protein
VVVVTVLVWAVLVLGCETFESGVEVEVDVVVVELVVDVGVLEVVADETVLVWLLVPLEALLSCVFVLEDEDEAALVDFEGEVVV